MNYHANNDAQLDKAFQYCSQGIIDKFPSALGIEELLKIIPSAIATDVSFSGATQQYLIRFATIPPLDVRNVESTAMFCASEGQIAFFSAINPRKISTEYPIGFATCGLLDSHTAYLQECQGICVSQSRKIPGIYPKSGVVLYCKALVERLATAGVENFLTFEPKAYASGNIYRRADDHGRWGWRPELNEDEVAKQRNNIRAKYERITRKIGGEVIQIRLPLSITSRLPFTPSLTVRKKRLAA